MLAKIALILLLLMSLSNQSVNAQDLKSELERSAPKQTKCFKGVELYYWHLDGKPVWTLLYGTNRLKTEEEIHNPKEAIKSLSQLEKLLGKLAPGEYVFFTTGTRTGGKPTPPAKSEESVAVKNLCAKLGLNYSGDEAE
jgi:hypothetical protein